MDLACQLSVSFRQASFSPSKLCHILVSLLLMDLSHDLFRAYDFLPAILPRRRRPG
jgi:hypothetical protein